MGCRHSSSSSPRSSHVKSIENGGPVILKSKISIQRSQVIEQRTSSNNKASRLSIITKKVNHY